MTSDRPRTSVPDVLIEAACELLPAAEPDECRVFTDGQFHDVVLASGIGAVRVARDVGRAAELRRVATLCERLAAADLPFAVPEPLGPVDEIVGRPALVTSWVPGCPAPRGSPRVAGARLLLEALAAVDVAALDGLLAPPHAYAGGESWRTLLVGEVVPRLPRRLRDEARRRIDAAAALGTPTAGLVHGDLAGDNVRWDGDDVVGVLDWDLAAAWDPAVDAACLAWHGWDTVRQVVDRDTYRRAVVWYRVFGLEQIAADLLTGAGPEAVEATVERISRWLHDTPHPPGW